MTTGDDTVEEGGERLEDHKPSLIAARARAEFPTDQEPGSPTAEAPPQDAAPRPARSQEAAVASAYMSEPGVVSLSPVSSSVFRPERIIGQPP